MRFTFNGTDEPPPDVPNGVVLGRWRGGEEALPVIGSQVVWPFEKMRRHAVIFGNAGSGRTRTGMRIAHEVATKSQAPVFYFDASGDPTTAERFQTLMRETGRRTRVFPDEPLDIWRGDGQQIFNRLLEVLDGDPDAPEFGDDDLILQRACNRAEGPPRSSAELLERLTQRSLLKVEDHFGSTHDMPRERIDRLRARYRIFFDGLDGALDGQWSWDDADAAYVRLDAGALGSRYAQAARLIFFGDFQHFFGQRKQTERPCLAVAAGLGEEITSSPKRLLRMLDQASVHHTGIVLSWNSPAAIGPAPQRDVIYGALGPMIVHAIKRPEEKIIETAGTRRESVPEPVHRFRNGEFEAEQVIRQEDVPKLTPEDLTELPSGTAWVIEGGRAGKVEIAASDG